MADLISPGFDNPSFGNIANGSPGAVAPDPNLPQEVKDQYSAGWMEMMQRPEIRAGLLQFGINALQPVPIGQSGIGGLAAAVGGGAEAYNKNVAAQNADQQRLIENAQKDRALDYTGTGQDIAREGNQLQFDASIYSSDARMRNAQIAAENRTALAQFAADNKLDIAETNKLDAAKTTWELFHPGEPFVPADHLATIRAGQADPRQGMPGPVPRKVQTETIVPGVAPPAAGAPGSTTNPIPAQSSEAIQLDPATEQGQKLYKAMKPGDKYMVPGRPDIFEKKSNF